MEYDHILKDLHRTNTKVQELIGQIHMLAEQGKERAKFDALVALAYEEALQASEKYPQPNYITLKIAEEAGEVVKAIIHHGEGRAPIQDVEKEIIQLLAMLIRYTTEGDGYMHWHFNPAPAVPTAAPTSEAPRPLCKYCNGLGNLTVAGYKAGETSRCVTCNFCGGSGLTPPVPDIPREQW